MDIIIIFFTFPGILITLGLLCFGWWYLFYVQQPRQFKQFSEYYQGSFTRSQAVVGCLVSFIYGEHRYGLRRTSNGGIEYGPVRTQNWLLSEVSAAEEFFIGNNRVEEYYFKFNLGSGDVQERVIFGGIEYKIGSNTEAVCKRIKHILEGDVQLQADMQLLYEKDWSHLRVKKERHLGKGVIGVMEYIGFPATFRENPESIKPYLDALERILKAVGV